ncbi:uncharacterized protein LOC133838460 isoform X1 [Drosophila sulfurigaster albostrigata]|uniref:uncharacterized protein LOC133838460 isoform X1 n=1 Tax=Drosophila sulfurigaster albostrigata TaxID=89887 RepID=UPI002D219EF4|nr:uncharacterized protein LOC133838460 isoform X1 [Drosophila sulfurigaster albostrigata]
MAVQAGKYLTEQPDDVIPCSLEDPDFTEILTKNLQTIFINWSDGLPDSDIVGPVDPFYIKELDLKRNSSPDDSEQINVNTDLKNIVVKGARRATISNLEYDPAKYEVKVTYEIPSLNIIFDYKVKGTSNSVILDEEGKGQLEVGYVALSFEVILKPRVKDEATFLEVVKVEASFGNVEDLKIKLDDLFGDDQERKKDAHAFLHRNWEDIFENFQPLFDYVARTMLADRAKKILSYIPANFIISDIR